MALRRPTLFILGLLLLGGTFTLSAGITSAAEIPQGCRQATATEAQQLSTAAGTNISIVCGNDANIMNLGEFDQFYGRLKQTSPCNSNKCTLACRTKNTGAQVCGSISRKWNSIGCHRINKTAIFPTVSHGFAAHIDLLRRYCGTYGRCTIASAIARWAPAGHGNNNPGKYAATVSKWAGFPVNKVYNPNDIGLMGRIALSMSCVENGAVPYSLDELKKGLVMAGGGARVPVPANVGQVLKDAMGYNPNSQQNPGGFLQNSPLGRFLGVPQTNNGSKSGSGSGSSSSNKPTTSSQKEPLLKYGDTSGNASSSSSVLDPISFGSSTPTSAQTPASTSSTPPPTIKNKNPTLLCLPTPINPGEEALILWACRDGAYKTVGENFNTNEALIGKTRVNPTQTTTYTLECINNTPKVDNTASSCTIQVANPQLALIATPRTTTRGRTVSLSWKTTDITSCTLTSNAHPTFTRNGTEGDVTSPSLIQNTTFTLTCETTTGSIKEKSVVVGVQ